MNVQQAIDWASGKITSDSARLDAEILLTYVLDKNRTWLKTWPDFQLTNAQHKNFEAAVERRTKGEPIAYIVGERDFWTLSLNTNSSTLIPRPETELLVEQALAFLSGKKCAKIIDLGCGTGAIALAIASERASDAVFGVDFNNQAVNLARENAIKNKITNAEFRQSDWFADVPDEKFDLIVSNPPYVAEGDPHLNQGDLVFEPNTALIAADNGFADIKHIADQARNYLVEDGALMFEHGFEQGEDVRRILIAAGFKAVKTVQDLAGLDRVTRGIM